jgi:RNA polymerase sigma-70 factor (ECF subfamily)
MNDDSSHLLIALLERIAHHDVTPARRRDAELALRELYDTTGGRLYAVALRVVGKAEWAEDVLQDTFLQVWRTAHDYRGTLSPPMAWLGLIARSRALDFLRRRAAERLDRSVELDDAMGDTLEGDSPDPADMHSASEHAHALHECLRKLDARHREVVSLAYYRDLSHGDLAQQLKLPLGTVKTWARRGLEQLRACRARFA